MAIAAATLSYLIGYAALAITIQGFEFVSGQITLVQRVLFLAAAICLLMPLIVWVKILGIVLLGIAWAPNLRTKK